MDDFSLFIWVYLLRSKFDVISIFPDFYKLIQTQFGVDIKFVRSDNAPELFIYLFF